MWIFSKSGFVSVVECKDASGDLMIRARVREDLKSLGKEISETDNSDYRFRVRMNRQEFAEVVLQNVLSIDYCNFKDAVYGDSERDRAYLKIWSAMYEFQENRNVEARRARSRRKLPKQGKRRRIDFRSS